MATLRKSFGFAVAFAALVVASSSNAATWSPMASISATAALVTNSLCYTDGTDLVCNGTGPALGGTSATVTTGASGSLIYRDGLGNLIASSSLSISSTTGSVGIGAGAPANLGSNGLYASGAIQTNSSVQVPFGFFANNLLSVGYAYGSSFSNASMAVNGNAAIGANLLAPSTTLHVSGTLRIADGGEACDTNRKGAIRYTSSSLFQTCDGTTGWTTLGAGAGGSGYAITSGTTSVTVNSGTSIISLTTAGTTWGYFGSTASYLPYLNSLRVSSTNISATAITLNGVPLTAGGGGQASPTSVPSFNVNKNGTNQTVGTSTWTKLTFANKVLDPFNSFDTTNSRFQPLVAGYYMLSANAYCGASTTCYVAIYKNGVSYNYSGTSGSGVSNTSTMVYLNGTTDYIEAYIYSAGSTSISGAIDLTSFSGSLIASGNGLASGTTVLAGLGDVALSAPSNGQVLTYNGTTSKWENAAGGGGSGDRITSSTSGVYVSSTGVVSLATSGSLVTYFNSAGMVTSGISTTGVVSATSVTIAGKPLSLNNLSEVSFTTALGTLVTAPGTTKTNFKGSGNTSYGVQSYSGGGSTGTAMGNKALWSNTGADNTAIGYTALLSNGNGYANTAIGSASMGNNETGIQNTAVGTESLGGTYTVGGGGNDNAALGSAAGYSSSSGSRNTYLGSNAGYNSSTGNSNTLVGYNAGTNITTGSSNLFLGASTTAVAATGNFQLNIGNAIWGNIGSSRSNKNLIGINVTSPTASLEVSGTISATALTVNGVAITGSGGGGGGDAIISGTTSVKTGNNASVTFVTNGTQRMIIGKTGEIGIGADPSDTYALNIVGKLRLQTDTGYNTFIGSDVAAFATNTTNNTIMGSGALVYGDNTEGITAVGEEAAFAVGTGSNYLTAVGFLAGTGNNGTNTTLIGVATGRNNQGTDVTAVGSDAANTNSGNYATFMGNSAGHDNAANGTTGLGWNAMFGNTSGLANTAVGFSAARTNQTGSYNTSVGYSAGLGDGSGSNNSANTLLGAYTGTAITTGSSNTVIGANSGMTLTTGSRNILIGAGVTPIAATGSSQLSIGNAIYGNIGSATGNANKIGINVSSPTTALEVSGTISATQFIGDGSLLTGIAGGGGGGDRITSSTTAAVVANQSVGTVSFTLGGTANAAYFHPTIGLVAKGVSTTGGISGSTLFGVSGQFNTTLNVGTNTAYNANSVVRIGGNNYSAMEIQGNRGSGGLQSTALNFVNETYPTATLNAYTGTNDKAGVLMINTANSAGTSIERMRITDTGNVGISTTSPNAKLDVNGTVSATGLVVNGSIQYTGTLTDASDRRLKTAIVPLPVASAVQALSQLAAVQYEMKSAPGIKEWGFIAQDFQKVMPSLVVTNNDVSRTLSLNYIGIIPVLVKANQELATENTHLKTRLDTLEQRLNRLESNAKPK